MLTRFILNEIKYLYEIANNLIWHNIAIYSPNVLDYTNDILDESSIQFGSFSRPTTQVLFLRNRHKPGWHCRALESPKDTWSPNVEYKIFFLIGWSTDHTPQCAHLNSYQRYGGIFIWFLQFPSMPSSMDPFMEVNKEIEEFLYVLWPRQFNYTDYIVNEFPLWAVHFVWQRVKLESIHLRFVNADRHTQWDSHYQCNILRLLGRLTIANDFAMRRCGDAVRANESLQSYLLAADDIVREE